MGLYLMRLCLRMAFLRRVSQKKLVDYFLSLSLQLLYIYLFRAFDTHIKRPARIYRVFLLISLVVL